MPETNETMWLLRSGVSPQAFMLHSALLAYAESPDEPWPSTRELAAVLGFNRRQSVIRYYGELVDAGVLEVSTADHSIHRGNVYTVRSTPDSEPKVLAPAEHAIQPREMTTLERLRSEFMKSAERKLVRARIDAGLCVCAVCGSTDGLQVDHVVALALGGTNEASNLQVLCGRCNRQKGIRVARLAVVQ